MKKKLICEKIGGSPQFVVPAPELMKEIIKLDSALWAATSAPCESFSINPKFISYLDPNNSGSIRVDEVIGAVNFLMAQFSSEQELNNLKASVRLAELKNGTDEAKDFQDFIKQSFDIADDDTELLLEQVSDKINAVSSGPLKGDGNLSADAVGNPEDLNLFKDILAINGKDKLTAELLDKFVADAEDFLKWEENTAKPELKVSDPVRAYSAYSALKTKLDEFFDYCQLVAVDLVNAERFKLNPENIPPLELKDPQVRADYLDSMPLAFPNAGLELKLSEGINARYEERVNDFSSAFKLKTLSLEGWKKIKQELAPYEEYCARIYDDPTGKLGRAKLEAYLNGPEIENLRKILADDAELSTTLEKLKKIEKMILFRLFMPEFINNFVNFKDLYTPLKNSLIQAGTLVIDGRHFDLNLFVKTPAEHKKYALRSNLCMIYVELVNKDKTAPAKYIAASVTTGSVNNLYVGKRGIFIDNTGTYWDAVMVDFVNGPISFWQTLFLPFRRAGESVSQRIIKLSSFNAIEQNMDKTIKTVETKNKSSLLSAGSIAVLCGSVGVAALGSGVAFAIKKLQDVSWVRIVLVFLGIILLVMTPAVVSALLKLRRRNLALFLEAAGWAVNLHLKLKSAIANTFTYRPGYEKSNNDTLFYTIVIIILIACLVYIFNSIFNWF